MKFVLKLKHWQLFFLVIGLPILTHSFDISKNKTSDIILGFIVVSTVFSWIWTIANELSTENESITNTDNFLVLLLFSITIYLGLMIYVVMFAARTLKTIELGRLAKINDYAADAFLIWMIPIGVWLIQPRLNKLTD